MKLSGDERQLRQMPSSAGGIDAVRLLTVHASKGLEFSVVYLPALGRTIFPASRKHNPCPSPEGMLSEDLKDSHPEEEECLFFVAMSRARDVICLSRSELYSGVKRGMSSLLVGLATHLPRAPDVPSGWCNSGLVTEEKDALVHLAINHDLHNAEDLDQYIKCPRAYLYQRILNLSGAREDNAYVQFHRAVYSVLRWIGGMEAGTKVSYEHARARLDTIWEEIGPADHPYAPVYREAAATILKRAITHRVSRAKLLDADWQIKRPGGLIRVRPDHVESGPDGVVVRRLRTGRAPKKVDDDIYALYQFAAAQELGEARVQALFLTSDEVVPISMSGKVIDNRLAKYDEAIAGIRKGHFPPKPNDRTCPRCPQYFICPAIPTVPT